MAPMSILMGPMLCGTYMCFFARMRGEEVKFGKLFKGFDHFLESFVAILIMTVINVMAHVPVVILVLVVGGVAIGQRVMLQQVEEPNIETGSQLISGEEVAPEMEFEPDAEPAGTEHGDEHAVSGHHMDEADHADHGRGDSGQFERAPLVGIGIFLVGNAIFLCVIMMIATVVGTFFVFSFQLIVDRGMKGWPATKMSFRAAKANFWTLLKLILVNTFVVLIASMFCYFPAFLILPHIFGTMALAYRRIFPEIEMTSEEPLPI